MADNPLGRSTEYPSTYSPELLFPIARSEKRNELDSNFLDFHGEDIWNAYELSWLDPNGLPKVAIGEFRIPADTTHIIESKSLKLYLNSLNQTHFQNRDAVCETIRQDISRMVNAPVSVRLYSADDCETYQVKAIEGELIDEQSIRIDDYSYHPEILSEPHTENTEKAVVEETLISHLLKSNCLITSQPDWATIQIHYRGTKINREKLLRYLVSFRSHNEFHEQCVERVFADIKRFCRPDKLTVYARYTRRGGLDINPWRSDFEDKLDNCRTSRQ